MKFSLKSKLSMTIALVVLLTVALISLLSNFFIQSRFEGYIASQQQKAAKQFAESISSQYNSKTDSWNTDLVHTIGMYALYDGYIIKVYDRNHSVVWDAEAGQMSLCTQIISDVSSRMLREYPAVKGKFTTKEYPAMQGSEEVGTISVGYYGPFFLSEEDFLFLDALNRILISTGIGALLISILAGIFLARHLSRPIMKTVEVTKDIADGKYGTRIREDTGTIEVDQLIGSINHLAGSLEKQETLRKRLTADVAHELRTPLTTVQAHMEAMLEGVWEPTKDRLGSCYEEMNRLGILVNDLENLARVESDNFKLNMTDVSLRELTDKVLTAYEKDLQSKNISAGVEGNCRKIRADRDRISQVLINLVSNAVKYTPEGGEIRITISDTVDSVVFDIGDNGIGIPEEELPFIFERFYRADKSRNRSTGGSGIGLAIVKSIVEAHGGTIDAASRLNEGSSFVITLPCFPDKIPGKN